MLPCDSHVHSEWSWDTGGPTSPAAGSMEQTCARAQTLGLPALVFTDHLDLTGWRIEADDVLEPLRELIAPNGILTPPAMDLVGYLGCVARCRHRFRDLRVLTGIELGQPHRDGDAAAQLFDLAELDRILGSLHNLQAGQHRCEPITLYRSWPADQVIWEYLAELIRMINGSDQFEILTHIDYAVRYWPEEKAGPFDPKRFEDGFRQAMRTLALSGRALEMNVGGPLRPWIPQWWSEEGGQAVSFGSDAHKPASVASNFLEAAAMVETFGFQPRRDPTDLWTR